jgi:D-3-phosphoglycerate dehydrogenase
MTNRKRVLVAKSVTESGWDLLRKRPDVDAIGFDPSMTVEAWRALLPGSNGIALDGRPFRAPEFACADAMQVIARVGVGYDSVDVAGCTAHGILLMTSGTANSVTVAEHAMSLMLELARCAANFDAMVREGNWAKRLASLRLDLAGRTVLVVGFGRIGSRIAVRLRAMEMQVLVADPYVDAGRIRAAGCEPLTLAAALPRADFVTVHCPKNAETTGLLGAAELAAMKRGAFVVNTARGGIVDEAALHAALASGHLAGAGLDVFVEEPVPTDHPLLQLPNVIVGPHIAGNSVEARERASIITVNNILSVLDGAPNVENVINKEALG